MPIDKKRIRKLASVLEKDQLPDGFKFRMEHFFKSIWKFDAPANSCHTAGCLAGTTILLFDKVTKPKGSRFFKWRRQSNPEHGAVFERAQKLLGLGCSDARHLFNPNACELHELNYEYITPRQAARVLRHLAKTGKVDWSVRGRR